MFDLLCQIPEEIDPELKKGLRWINDKAFSEGKTTYETVEEILRVRVARNNRMLRQNELN